ncbi:hypothetical protein IGI04_011970 [Brassica rapa subsp. trilocularis]|uniref:Uncharacterized protein n=1 Tax=Brassica rapa subsp. trilocularis TaxID=1813537 RepID=A0ABQ7N6S6_BRACM|nr:hypothetical protein IGI04_011970 [Brassica rapa subsp. trilocularis]
MVGDIHGKTCGSSSRSRSGSGIGVVNKDPSLFGDLVGSAIGQSSGNVPLKKPLLLLLERPVWVLWLVSDQNHQEAQPERLTKKKKGNAQSDAFTKGGSFAGSTDALPPPSPSVSATSAKTKGIDSQKQVLEHDKKNVSILVQRALLYESMEKYKMGAEDL